MSNEEKTNCDFCNQSLQFGKDDIFECDCTHHTVACIACANKCAAKHCDICCTQTCLYCSIQCPLCDNETCDENTCDNFVCTWCRKVKGCSSHFISYYSGVWVDKMECWQCHSGRIIDSIKKLNEKLIVKVNEMNKDIETLKKDVLLNPKDWQLLQYKLNKKFIEFSQCDMKIQRNIQELLYTIKFEKDTSQQANNGNH